MSKQNKAPDPTLVISEGSLSTTRWMTKEELATLFFEEIKERQVNFFSFLFNVLLRLLTLYHGPYLEWAFYVIIYIT